MFRLIVLAMCVARVALRDCYDAPPPVFMRAARTAREDPMAETVQIDFTALKDAGAAPKGRGAKASGGTLVVLAGSDLSMSAETLAILGDAADLVKRAAATAKFKGASGSALDILAPAGLPFERLMVIGTAKKPAKDVKNTAAPVAPSAPQRSADCSRLRVLYDSHPDSCSPTCPRAGGNWKFSSTWGLDDARSVSNPSGGIPLV